MPRGKKRKAGRFIAIILVFMLLPLTYFSVKTTLMLYYLRDCGLGLRELPAAMDVAGGKSDGVTVKNIGNDSVFIGRPDTGYYYDIIEKNGCKYYDQLGACTRFEHKNTPSKHLSITRHSGNRWFAVYGLGGTTYTIEDLMENAGS